MMNRALAGEFQTTEAALSKIFGLMGAVVDYAKVRPVFDGYKAARAAMNELLGGEKLPKMDALKKQRRELADKNLQRKVNNESKQEVRRNVEKMGIAKQSSRKSWTERDK